MSRRFGRNQRRRAREALATAESTIASIAARADSLNNLVAELGAQVCEAKDWAREVAEMVGRQAIIAGEPILLKGDAFDRMRMPIYPRDVSTSLFGTVARIEPIRDEVLRLLSVQTVAYDMAHQVHARVTLSDKTTGYAISGAALRQMTAKEIERRIAPEIARHLAQQLKAFR